MSENSWTKSYILPEGFLDVVSKILVSAFSALKNSANSSWSSSKMTSSSSTFTVSLGILLFSIVIGMLAFSLSSSNCGFSFSSLRRNLIIFFFSLSISLALRLTALYLLTLFLIS
eukprot:NODE_89_length_21810_cov_0.170098.p14 type:complete len:115 gc:universal NODE_89_length_21810_cov_0.170098:18416-18760(+)